MSILMRGLCGEVAGEERLPGQSDDAEGVVQEVQHPTRITEPVTMPV